MVNCKALDVWLCLTGLRGQDDLIIPLYYDLRAARRIVYGHGHKFDGKWTICICPVADPYP